MSWTLLNPATTEAELKQPFTAQDFSYCQILSETILKDPQSRDFPDLIALGFWLRQANLKPLLAPYQHSERFIRQPLGLVFHNAPANVDSLFVYSGILSLLCGNKNVIRLSSRSGGSTAILLEKIRNVATIFPEQNARFQLVQCDYESTELKKLISKVDGRVLWGTDKSIIEQRKLEIPAHARELSFGHKFSLCLLDAQAVLAASDTELQQMTQLFYRDQLTFSQQACSSAKAVIWLGDRHSVKKAQKKFWSALTLLIERRKPLNASEQYKALATAQYMIMSNMQHISQIQNNIVSRLEVASLEPRFTEQHQGCGLFLELTVSDLQQLNSMLSREHQTLSVWGIERETLKIWLKSLHTGVDRVVPVGQALNFSPDWDGMNLIDQLSRNRLVSC